VDKSFINRALQQFAQLDDRQLRLVSMYVDLLIKWNARINLTAVRDPAEIVSRHFGESFFAARKLLPSSSDTRNAIDFGSGAGFPGLPLAIWASDVQVTLIESSGKKAAFLNEVIRHLQLPNASVFSGRAETFRGLSNLVTMRAVDKFLDALPLACALVDRGETDRREEEMGGALARGTGRLALMVGAAQIEEISRFTPSFAWQEPEPIPASASRVLLVGTRTASPG